MDMIVSVEPEYLKKYNLLPDSIQIAENHHAPIYTDIETHPDVKFCPGGSALNTVRMTQKLLGSPQNVITLVGAVGADDTGKVLVETVRKEGINMVAQFVEGLPTGKCASLVTSGGSARTMITDLGAALHFSRETFINSRVDTEWLDKAKVVYISGYFLKVSPATVMHVVKQANARNIPILLNLNAIWVTKSCLKELIAVLPFTDIIFGNDSEVLSLVDLLGIHSQESQAIMEQAKALSTHMYNLDLKHIKNDKFVIVTRGALPVICSKNGQVTCYPVQSVSPEELVDTTGAGDAFVGGFLGHYISGNCIPECTESGIRTATEELKGYGFVLPSSPTHEA